MSPPTGPTDVGAQVDIFGTGFAPGATVTAVARYPHHLDVFTIGTDNRVYTTWWDERTGWQGWFRPGDLTTMTPHIARPEGRLHFAGEHASRLPGWIQGAIESGQRAADEVHAAP